MQVAYQRLRVVVSACHIDFHIPKVIWMLTYYDVISATGVFGINPILTSRNRMVGFYVYQI